MVSKTRLLQLAAPCLCLAVCCVVTVDSKPADFQLNYPHFNPYDLNRGVQSKDLNMIKYDQTLSEGQPELMKLFSDLEAVIKLPAMMSNYRGGDEIRMTRRRKKHNT